MKWSVDLPCVVGTIVWYAVDTTAQLYIKCIVDEYKVNTKGTSVHLVPIDDIDAGISEIWIDAKNLETSILIKDPGDVKDIHLYQAIAFYYLNNDVKFEINDLPIHHIENDGTIVTNHMHAVGQTVISDKFAGVKSLNIMKDIKLSDDCFAFYSTNRKECKDFIFKHLENFESNLCRYQSIVEQVRSRFKKL